jgi:arsenate reductase
MNSDNSKTKVLFVCIGNQIRSQMAEGFARHSGGAFVTVFSAGVAHSGIVGHETVEVMREKGIDISRQYSKGLSDVPIGEMDYIVNISGYPAEKVFPAAVNAKVIVWDISDPLGEGVDKFRTARDIIEAKVDALLREIWQGKPD